MLAPQKVTTTNAVLRRRLTFRLSHEMAVVAKEEGTHHHGLRLPSVAQQSKRSRNSTWWPAHTAAHCGIRTVAPSSLTLFPLLSVMGWDLSHQTHGVEVRTVSTSKPDWINQKLWHSLGLWGPHLPRRVAQPKQDEGSVCPSPAAAHDLCELPGRVSRPLVLASNAGNKRKLGCTFFW